MSLDTANYPIDVFVHDGLAYAADTTPEFVRNIEAFPVDDDDVIVVGFPKSGTNWLNITLANLYDHWGTAKITPGGVVPEFSVPTRPAVGLQGYDQCIAAAPPRLIKTHLPYAFMPRAFREGKGRVVFIARNPKDVCDSFYNNMRSAMHDGWGWNEHVEAFLRGSVPFGPWLDSVLGWHEQKGNPRILRLTYEGMQMDRQATLEAIVDFVGPTKPGAIERAIAATGFEAMKKNGIDRQYQPGMARREGKIGGWKKHFNVDQSERFDAKFETTLRARGIHFTYEA